MVGVPPARSCVSGVAAIVTSGVAAVVLSGVAAVVLAALSLQF